MKTKKQLIEELVMVGWKLSSEGWNSEYCGFSGNDPNSIECFDEDNGARKEIERLLNEYLNQTT